MLVSVDRLRDAEGTTGLQCAETVHCGAEHADRVDHVGGADVVVAQGGAEHDDDGAGHFLVFGVVRGWGSDAGDDQAG
jgi:hypothetical protein